MGALAADGMEETVCKLRSDQVTRLYRPVSTVEPVEPDESDHIVAEWLSMYDPRYHTET